MIPSLTRHFTEHMRGAWFAYRHRKARLSPALVQELISGLGAEKQALLSFTAAMEDEFVELGSLLQEIIFLSREVQERSNEVMAAAAGRTEGAAIHFAFRLLKKAEDLVDASREHYQNVFAVFARMHVDLNRIARERDALMRALLPLETTNAQFRIQACAFDEDTRGRFFVLADDIHEVVSEVQTAVQRRFEELDRTSQVTGELTGRLRALTAGQKQKTVRLLMETRGHLSTLNQALLSSESAAQSISQAGGNIATGVGGAMVSLQCQDMARQKIQHIAAAIDEMMGRLTQGSRTRFGRDEEAGCRHYLAKASHVQLKQLETVFDQLDKAAHEVGDGLLAVEMETKSFAQGATRSGGATLDGQIIAQAIQSIHDVLGVIDDAVTSIRDVNELVQKLKSTFNDCTSQILTLALRLRTVALNAQILAAQVESGSALEVVASNTRIIADEAMQHLEETSDGVNELIASVSDIEQRLGDYQELAVMEQELLASEAGQSQDRLQALEGKLRSGLAAIGPLERRLSETIKLAIGSIRFPETVAKARTSSTALFEGITSDAGPLDDDSEGDAHLEIHELTHNYTMANEREIHELAIETDFSQGAAVAKWDGEFDVDEEPRPQRQEQTTTPDDTEPHEEKLPDNTELF